MEIDYVKMGKQLKRIRKARGMKQRDCAAAIQQCSLAFYGHIERGTRRMSMDTFCALVTAMDLSADELLRASMKGG